MFTFWLIVLVLACIVGVIIFVTALSENEDVVGMTIVASVLLFGGILCIAGLFGAFDKTEPSALDVYRGYTTLEITYRDSVAIDTTVVWKDEFKSNKD